jgi:sarcosine oxidase subunit alpha
MSTDHAHDSGLIEIAIDGEVRRVTPETSVAAAILNAGGGGGWSLRESVTGEARGPLCGMGTCHECRVTINAVPHERSCMVLCQPGMVIRTDFMPPLAIAAEPKT